MQNIKFLINNQVQKYSYRHFCGQKGILSLYHQATKNVDIINKDIFLVF